MSIQFHRLFPHPRRFAVAVLMLSGCLIAGCDKSGDNIAESETDPTAEPRSDSQRAEAPDSDLERRERDGFTEIRSQLSRTDEPSAGLDDTESLATHNADFAFELYEGLAAQMEGENLFFSPHSISTALAMVYAGAEGETAAQIKKALHFELSDDQLHPAFNRLSTALEQAGQDAGQTKGGSPFELNIANAIWGQKNLDVNQPFLDVLARHYDAGLHAVNFADEPEQSRKTINKWVERKTEDKINDLLPEGSVQDSTRMVLTNAIYFNASWRHKFDSEATQKAQFTTGDGTDVEVDMMQLEERNGLSFADGGNWKAVEMPYVGGQMSMVVVVPDAGKFTDVEAELSGDWLADVFDQLEGHAVELAFPKFEFETEFSVKKQLQSLGMKDAFDFQRADLTGITEDVDLAVDDILHKAFVAVDENGTEAAAATAAGMVATSLEDTEFKELSVDRPFLFTIRDRKTGAVVFAGRVLDPS